MYRRTYLVGTGNLPMMNCTRAKVLFDWQEKLNIEVELPSSCEDSKQLNWLSRRLQINCFNFMSIRAWSLHLPFNKWRCFCEKIAEPPRQPSACNHKLNFLQTSAISFKSSNAPSTWNHFNCSIRQKKFLNMKFLITVEPQVAFTKNGLRFFLIASFIFNSKSSASIWPKSLVLIKIKFCIPMPRKFAPLIAE